MIAEILKYKLSGNLPGIDAHLKMAPEHRAFQLLAVHDADFNPRLSAVLVILFPDEDKLKVVLIRRSDYVGFHSGQISFPGGRYEESDGDLRVTALREVEEEIGVAADSIELLGQLSDIYVPISNFMVRAYVVYAKKRPSYKPDSREVKEIIEVDLDYFFKDNIVKWKNFPSYNSTHITRAPYYDVDGNVIWGATAMIICELIELLK